MAAESAIDETNLEREEVKVALMEAGAFKEIRPKEYLFRFLEKGVRPDHRTPDTTRDMIQSVGISTVCHGSSMVRCGGTTVVCGVQGMVTSPLEESPREGALEVEVELSRLSEGLSEDTLGFSVLRWQDGLCASVRRSYLESGCLDLSGLCIVAGKAVWVLKATVTVLEHGGGVEGVAGYALGLALADTRLPHVTPVPGGGVREHPTHPPLPLVPSILRSITRPFPFAVIAPPDPTQSLHFLVDPTREEEDVASAQVTITLSMPLSTAPPHHPQLHEATVAGIHHSGKEPLHPSHLQQCLETALNIAHGKKKAGKEGAGE